MALAEVIGNEAIERITQSGQLTFHVIGDSGGVKDPKPQQVVAMKLEEDLKASQGTPADPAFLYHLGDVVYYNGEASRYYDQFYYPYEHYDRPIFAIPGNHDGAPIDSDVPSLAAFVENFCADHPHQTQEAGDTHRTAMTQPNVYWTLEAPFATIVGLYTNVPEGGEVHDDQREWFVNELRAADSEKALIVTLHHPAYSADDHHSGSAAMLELIDGAAKEAERFPDLVLSAHVHNYQRFTRHMDDGRQVPFIVCGAGGYWHLHYVGKLPDGSDLPVPSVQPNLGIRLEAYEDDHHGFLKLGVTKEMITGTYYAAPRPQDSFRRRPSAVDRWAYNWRTHEVVLPRLP